MTISLIVIFISLIFIFITMLFYNNKFKKMNNRIIELEIETKMISELDFTKEIKQKKNNINTNKVGTWKKF